MVRSQNGGMAQKMFGPYKGRGQSAERSEKIQTSTIKMGGPKDAIVRSQNGEAQGRVDWKRDGWPDAKFEGTSAKWDLRNEQQREKREESRERREKREESREG